jgi:hypothetical protein
MLCVAYRTLGLGTSRLELVAVVSKWRHADRVCSTDRDPDRVAVAWLQLGVSASWLTHRYVTVERLAERERAADLRPTTGAELCRPVDGQYEEEHLLPAQSLLLLHPKGTTGAGSSPDRKYCIRVGPWPLGFKLRVWTRTTGALPSTVRFPRRNPLHYSRC